MLKRIGLCFFVLALSCAGSAYAQCVVDTSTPTYANGAFLRYTPCDANGKIKTTGSGGGGGGDASEAEQQTQTGILTTIDADTGAISLGVGGTADAAATAGSTGSLNAKLRLMSSQLDSIKTAVETLDNIVSSNRASVTLYDSSGNEIVVPTAGLTSYTAAGASTNCTNVKNAAGTVYHVSVSNTTTTVYYLRWYNLSSTPTASSATGYVSSLPIPPAAASGQVGGRETPYNIGKAFTTGVGFCITGGASSTDNTNAATGVFVEILYK